MVSKRKKHYETEEWIDFVNHQLSAESTKSMQRHLDSGCTPCRKLADTWQRVNQSASRERSYSPPESAVRHVRSAFSVMTQSQRAKRYFEVPRLVFDSLWQPLTAGVRSGHKAPRQVLYKAREIKIEMRLEPEPISERLSIAGQVSRMTKDGEGLADIPVVVSSGENKIAEALTNRFGEFHVAFVPQNGLRISFGVVPEKELSIPLDGEGVSIYYRN
jgi:hypothetical protein